MQRVDSGKHSMWHCAGSSNLEMYKRVGADLHFNAEA